MEMSMVEVTCRANFLIYDYIKRQLNHNGLAEQFRKVIQDSAHKDIIIFKGLDDLTMVLMKYYSSLGLPARESNGAMAGNPTEVKVDAVTTEASPDDGAKEERKKKKKKKQRKTDDAEQPPEPEAEAEHSEAASAPPLEQQQHEDAAEADTTSERKKKKKKRRLEVEAEQPEETAAVEAEAEPEPKKKRKRSRTAAEPAEVNQENGHQDSKEEVDYHQQQGDDAPSAAADANGGAAVNGGKKKRHSQPFRRVREEEVVNKHFQDNSFDAKPGSANSWGYKANEDLRPTQGRSFRHEKTKKKRGSYKGGAIDTGVSSFKFESDSD